MRGARLHHVACGRDQATVSRPAPTLRVVAAAQHPADQPELVLVLPRDAVPGGCAFRGLRVVDADALARLHEAVAAHARYLPRSEAEEDPSFKQLIPYVVVRDRGRIFLMERTRAGGDPRLHLKATIGVGGHLNPVDGGADPLMDGLRREWEEELDAAFEPTFELAGFLNDDTNAVGAVHLGVVFTVEARGTVEVRERDKLSGRFADADEVRAAWDRLETWSQLTLEWLSGAVAGVVNRGQ
jgi:predicted NUDIX family phosphoesterase